VVELCAREEICEFFGEVPIGWRVKRGELLYGVVGLPAVIIRL
jgi:hypothetical protein